MTNTTRGRKKIGNLGEKLALEFLEKKQYRLREKNFRIPGGEIDLVMEKDGILVFVEVKTRTNQTFGAGGSAFRYLQKRALLRTIFQYLGKTDPQNPWRLDLVSIELNETRKTASVQHFFNILV